jgi:hypothetical protein
MTLKCRFCKKEIVIENGDFKPMREHAKTHRIRMAMLMASNETMGEFIDSLAFSSLDKKDWRALQNALLDWVLTDGPGGPIS